MERIASEMMRNYMNSQNFSSTAEIIEAMKDLFPDALRQVIEGELEERLGYEKSERLSETKKMHGRKITETGIQKKRKNAAGQGGRQNSTRPKR